MGLSVGVFRSWVWYFSGHSGENWMVCVHARVHACVGDWEGWNYG